MYFAGIIIHKGMKKTEQVLRNGNIVIDYDQTLTTKEIKKPAGFEKMLEISRKLSKGFPHVRVDLYDINGQIYFGDISFF